MADLRFRAPLDASHPVRLIFGAGEGGGDDAALLHVAFVLPAPQVAFEATAYVRADVTIAFALPAPAVAVRAAYDLAMTTGPQAGASARWQQAQPGAQQLARVSWRRASDRHAAGRIPWRRGALLVSESAAPWQVLARRPVWMQAAWQEAEHRALRPRAVRWQAASQTHCAASAAWQEAAPCAVRSSRVRWQEMARHARPDISLPWGEAAGRAGGLQLPFGAAAPRQVELHGPWQEARRPPPGRSSLVRPQPPVEPPCYSPPPGLLAHLIFAALADPATRLLFTCRVDGGPAQFVIPIRRVYMAVHEIECVRLPDMTEVPLLGASLSADADSFGWTLQATGPVTLLDLLTPSAGEPARIRLTLDGIAWVFVVEGLRRERRFGQARVQITGRSLTALLGEPYSAPRTWLNAQTRTARQLVEDALQYTGATLDWAATDWLVGEGAWSFSGTPLAAALRVADSIGAVVQSHWSDPQLIVLPRYPLPPWEWHQAVPDVQLPLASVITDGFERVDSPGYTGVYVSGETQGVLAWVRRGGTAGDMLAPMVTDPLITHADAARQRGTAILSAAGPRARVSLTLPVLTGGSLPGVLRVGQLVEVVEPGDTWRGLVRGVDVQAELPRVRQTVVLERAL
ncbi:MAG: hypothetical protein ACK4ZD_06200 [Caldimonas sp.]|uniref:hypothetical protein n=1 Tax=Caldimonas sp. TaxID=2838790 RepID=UPI00391AAF6F